MRSPLRAGLTTVAVVCVALTSLVAPAAAGTSAGARVPFVGVFRGVETTTFVPPSTAAITGEWKGVATGLGLFTVENPHIVDVVTMTGTGKFVFTAANGDTLTTDDVGTASLTANPDVLFIVEHANIKGGTGRFAGAAGSFIVKRLLNRVDGSTIGFFAGSISTH